jgi:hypothetical protein
LSVIIAPSYLHSWPPQVSMSAPTTSDANVPLIVIAKKKTAIAIALYSTAMIA